MKNPKTFTVKIDLGDDAMQTPNDVAGVLRILAAQLDHGKKINLSALKGGDIITLGRTRIIVRFE